MFTLFTACLTIAALIGVVLNIKKNIISFYIWFFTNISWCIVDFYRHIPMQSFLFFIYTILSVYGIYEWRKKKNG